MRKFGVTSITAYRGRYSRKTLERLMHELIYQMRKHDVIATQRMIKSVRVGYNAVVIDVPYAYYVNTGTKPHYPPLKPLIEWAMYKFGVDRRSAFAIAKSLQEKIRMNGTKPHRFIDDALDALGLERVETLRAGTSTILRVRRRRRRMSEKW